MFDRRSLGWRVKNIPVVSVEKEMWEEVLDLILGSQFV
jgi:hypothetical protein